MLAKKLLGIVTAFAAAIALIPSAPMPESTAAEESKLIALTFDDGPNTTTTNEILDLLEQYNAKASFFLIGANINEESAVTVKRAYDMGCEIDNHSKTHSNMSSMSPEEIEAELEYVDEWVYQITGEYPKFFRPPFIDTSAVMYETIDLPFICGIDCQDYMESVTAQQRADYILNGAKDGVIVLLHDAAGNTQTVEALEIVLPELQAQGYEFVTLTELFERQGETPKGNMIYTEVAKYPCGGYTQYQNIFTGEASGESSWSGWSETAVLDGAVLESLGDSYAIEVAYSSADHPVIALQKWSGASIWQTVKPFYYNGETACFLASDLNAALESLGVSYTDLDKISITPFASAMTMTQVDILVRSGFSDDTVITGDVNNDQTFNITDIVAMQKWLTNQDSLSAWQNGDLNKDGVLTAFDLVLMHRAILNP